MQVLERASRKPKEDLSGFPNISPILGTKLRKNRSLKINIILKN
jgi:hypothetical protein